ncbi:radical SAM protein [Paenibacillus sp. FSL M8-0228]|nr:MULTISPECIES: radical SAM protein [Paenibacillus]MBO3283905.1 SPASM domain-containing protein [Paenibacillus polymyxa]MBP1311059.1 uncharacterized protein [Paenibacillus sp. 1182]ODB50556.1 hypothetical protein A7311_08605 [Paenibacillus polymyxa]
MRVSSYNEYLLLNDSDEESYLIYNSLSNGFGEIHKGLYNALIQKDMDYLEHCAEKEQLLQGQFLYVGPIKELDQMEEQFKIVRHQNETLNLTILPTFSCNFRCSYCFENLTSKSGKRAFSQKIQNEILTYIEKSVEELHFKRIIVNWTGGEPLLEFKNITSLMERINFIANKNKISIDHFMVSNGYLLTSDRAKKLKELGVKRIQITIDGSKKSHDQRRILANKEGTFDKIIENINKSCEFIHITIRTNVDLDNIHFMNEYIEYMGRQLFKDKVSIYFSATTEYSAGGCVSNSSCYANKDFSKVIIKLYECALEKGLNISYYPQYEPVACAAIAANSMVIQPDGGIQKCWNTVGNKNYLIGHISENFSIEQLNSNKWIDYSPYKFEKCRGCNVLPLCGGGCAQQAFESEEKQPVCREFKYNLEEMLAFNFRHQ